MNKNFSQFTYRHIGSNQKEQDKMLDELDCNSLDELINSILPKNIIQKDKCLNYQEQIKILKVILVWDIIII